jgi:hypothetical protein
MRLKLTGADRSMEAECCALVAQSRFHRLDAPELLADIYHGVTYADGRRSSESKGRVAA